MKLWDGSAKHSMRTWQCTRHIFSINFSWDTFCAYFTFLKMCIFFLKDSTWFFVKNSKREWYSDKIFTIPLFRCAKLYFRRERKQRQFSLISSGNSWFNHDVIADGVRVAKYEILEICRILLECEML